METPPQPQPDTRPDPGAPSASGAHASHGALRPAPTHPLRRALALFIASGAGSGYAPVASGTFGSAVGVALYAAVAPFGLGAVVFTTLVASGIGIWASDDAERIYQSEDDGRIVIDEIAGQLIALLPLSWLAPAAVHAPLPLLAAFLVFRGFDIWKPGPVRWAERNFPGGLGVMADDLLAGVLSALVVAGALAAGWLA